MRKLITGLSFAAFAAAGIIGLTGPSLAGDGGLRIVYEYPNPTISDSNSPVFASEEAWFNQGGGPGGRPPSAAVTAGHKSPATWITTPRS